MRKESQCSNCTRDRGLVCVLCDFCLSLYLSGQPVQGRGRVIQCDPNEVTPEQMRMDL